MARGKQVIQLLRAITKIARPQGASIEELERELGVGRRSVYRELITIQELGFPLEEPEMAPDKRKRHRLMADYVRKLPNITVPDLMLNIEELIALNMLRGDTGLYAGTELAATIDRAFKKLGSFLPDATMEKLKRLGTLFVSGSRLNKDYSDKDELIQELTTAMLQMKTCRIAYHSFTDNTVKNFRIDPLHFYELDGGLYLFVHIPKFRTIRTLAVERIQTVEGTEERFTMPKDFRPEERINSAFQITYDDPIAVRIQFAPSVAKYIEERRWAPEQKLERAEDGSVTLEMSTSGRKEVLMWVLSFGGDARVLAPEDLRASVIAEAKRAAAQYE